MRRAKGDERGPADHDRLHRHRYGQLIEPLTDAASFLAKPMFGCLACYLHGRLMLVLADRREPWRGMLVPTRREEQPALRAEMPALRVHPVLGKWLYLPESCEDFDEVATRLVALASADDPRLGVESLPRRRVAARRRVARRGRRGG